MKTGKVTYFGKEESFKNTTAENKIMHEKKLCTLPIHSFRLNGLSLNLNCFKVEDAQTDEDIRKLCDEPKFSTVFDRSGWPIGRVLNMKSKADFVTYMLVEELVVNAFSCSKTSEMA